MHLKDQQYNTVKINSGAVRRQRRRVFSCICNFCCCICLFVLIVVKRRSTPWTSDKTEEERVKASKREKKKKSQPASFTICSYLTFTCTIESAKKTWKWGNFEEEKTTSCCAFFRNLDTRVCRRSPNIPGKAISSRTVLLREEAPWIVWSRTDK